MARKLSTPVFMVERLAPTIIMELQKPPNEDFTPEG